VVLLNEEIKITLPDSSILSAQKGNSVYQIVGNIGKGLQKAAICAKVNTDLVDLSYKINSDAKLSVFTFDSPEGRTAFWHSTSHLMAQAVKRLFPQAKPAIGPAIDEKLKPRCRKSRKRILK
jgi:threonyl-tRNA synthetase